MEPHEGAAAAVLDLEGRLLLIKENYDRRRYSFPSGAVKSGETLDAVVRETLEETGVLVSVEPSFGTPAADQLTRAARRLETVRT